MENHELIQRFKIAKKKYYSERAQIADEYFKTNLNFKIGDVVLVKSRYGWEGCMYVNRIYFSNIDNYINEPYKYIPVIEISGWSVKDNGCFGRILSSYDSRTANAKDVVKVVDIKLREPLPND